MTEAKRQRLIVPERWSPFVEFLAGPVTWAVYFLGGYLLVEAACGIGFWANYAFLGLTVLGVVVVGLTLFALILTLVAAWAAYRDYRQIREWEDNASRQVPDEGRQPFVAFTGLVMSLLFGALILLTGIPMFILRPCVWGG